MQKMHNAGLIFAVKSLREEMNDTRSKQEATMDVRIPPMNQKYILERLKKEYTMERTIQTLTSRIEAVEKNLQLVLQNQITQAELLNKLLTTHFGSLSIQLDDNKKGKKDKEDQQIKEDQYIKGVAQQIRSQQINLKEQQIKFIKRKSSSTDIQQSSKENQAWSGSH